MRADRELWTLVAQEVTGSLKMQGNVIPLDAHVTRLTTDPRISMLLLPLPTGHRATDPSDETKKTTPKAKATPGPKKPANKRKTRAERGCPEELKKYTLRVAEGQICWNYNLKDGCQLPTSGKPQKCHRGLHICACCHKPGHSAVVCRSAKGS